MTMNANGNHLSIESVKVIGDHILSNPNAQALTATITTSLALDRVMLEIIPKYIAIVGGTLGLILTAMMIVHKYIQIRNDLGKK